MANFQSKTSRFIVLGTLLSAFACSRPATCALEGCSNDNSVNLAPSADPASSDADAKPASKEVDDKLSSLKKELEEKLGAITDRASLADALATLHSQTLELHEQRIKALEAGATDQAASIAEINTKIAENKASIEALDQEVADNYQDLSDQLAAQAQKESDDIDLLQASIDQATADLKAEIGETSQGLYGEIMAELAIERGRRKAADKRVRAAALNAVAELDDKLEDAIEALERVDKENLRALNRKIKDLDEKVNKIATIGTIFASIVANEIVNLQGEIKRLDNADTANFKLLKGKIANLRGDLNSEVARLDEAMRQALVRIVALENGQATQQSNLEKLESRVTLLAGTQSFINLILAGSINDLGQKIADLRKDVQEQIDDVYKKNKDLIAGEIKKVSGQIDNMKDDIKSLQSKADDLSKRMKSAEKDVDDLESDIAGLKSSMQSKDKELKDSITALEKLVKAKSECEFGKVETSGSGSNAKKYREITCDKETIKVLVP